MSMNTAYRRPEPITISLYAALVAGIVAGAMGAYAAMLQLGSMPVCQADPIATIILQDEAARASL